MFESIFAALLGGLLVGLAAVIMLLVAGQITGVSGIFSQALSAQTPWRIFFILGLVIGGLITNHFLADNPFLTQELGLVIAKLPNTWDTSWIQVAIAGLLVGFGSQFGSGCTSGHGICGIGRLSKRSIVATMTFMLSAAVCVYVVGV